MDEIRESLGQALTYVAVFLTVWSVVSTIVGLSAALFIVSKSANATERRNRYLAQDCQEREAEAESLSRRLASAEQRLLCFKGDLSNLLRE